jgi:transposase
MAETHTLSIQHERVDDVPLIIGVANHLGLADLLNRHLGTHGSQQGLHNGLLAVGWLAYILSQADHRKSAVQDWANGLAYTLHHLLGQPIRDVDFSDDRLGALLHRLNNDAAWQAIEQDLWAASVTVYDLPLDGIRLDATTGAGYHRPTPDGLMQHGHSKDHRPDLPQLKLMAAAAEPTGQLIASDIVPGQSADDPLYTPLIRRVRTLLGQRGLLYSGDCKMAALATRADIVAHGDYYLTALPHTGETAREFDTWVNAIVDGEQTATLIWDAGELIGAGYEFERPQTTSYTDAQGNLQTLAWTERVLVTRALELAHTQATHLEQRLQRATTALAALTPAPAKGKRQIRDETVLRQAIQQILERERVQELLTVEWAVETTTMTRQQGRGRPCAQRERHTAHQVRYVIRQVQRNESAITAHRHRLGWRVQVTNAHPAQLLLAQAVVRYRGGWVLERDFRLVKELPLGLSPLFVWKDDQIKGLTRLLTLALRLLTLIESQVRQGLQQTGKRLRGLYAGQATRETDRPTGKRILQAFARAQITLSRVVTDAQTTWHITPLSELHTQVLRYLRLPATLYAALINNSS